MKQPYIPPHKQPAYLFNNIDVKNNIDLKNNIDANNDIEFPKLNINSNYGSSNSKWSKPLTFSEILKSNSCESYDNSNNTFNTPNRVREKQTQFLKNQKNNRNRLFKITLEQAERDKINYELQEESPYWNEKNLLDPESDNSEEEYDINKQEESCNNNNNDTTEDN